MSSANALAVRRHLTDARRLCSALGLLRGYKPGRQHGGGLLIRCPVHGDKHPSCSVRTGPDGTLQVHCFVCGFGGDALSLVAAARGLDLRHDFPRVVEEAARLTGASLDLSTLPPSKPAPAPLAYPDQAEVAALWDACLPVDHDDQAVAYLLKRALDPALVARFDLARVLPLDTPTPPWSRLGRHSWAQSGHRLLFPMVDAHGHVRSLRASLLGDPINGLPKRIAPAGKASSGLVLACPQARHLLAADHHAPADVVVAEGEFDFLTWALRLRGLPTAVFGVVACAWSDSLAARIPDRSSLFLRTHQDAAGDKYAAAIRASLAPRPIVLFDFPGRDQPRSASLPDDNDLAQRGPLPPFAHGLVCTSHPLDHNLDSDAPASAVRPRQSPPLLSADEALTALAAALRSDDPLVAARSTPGVGKSALQRQVVHEHTSTGAHALISVSSHDLAQQTVAELSKLGVKASAARGVARVRLPLLHNDKPQDPVCLHAEEADLLAQAGLSARQTLCTHCPARTKHPATGAACPAYEDGSEPAPVTVIQQTVLAPLLAEHTQRLLRSKEGSSNAPAASLTVLDEHVAPTTTTDLTGALAAFRELERELRSDVRERIAPLLLAALAGAPHAPPAASLRQLASLGGLGSDDLDKAFDEVRPLDGQKLWSGGFLHSLGRLAVFQPGPAARSKLTLLARTTALLEALVDAAHDPDRPALWTDEAGVQRLITAARWTRRVVPYVQAGGKVRYLDATANESELRALWDDALRFVHLDVVDAPLVERRCIVWQHAARRRHTHADNTPIAEQVRGPLRTIARIAAERRAQKMAIVTDKPLADALRAWLALPPGSPLPALVPKELAALVASGVELRVRHYGHQRGLDALADVELLVTLGDPWPHLGEARAQARALGLDSEAWAMEQARAELLQAWGRARPVHRTTPVLILHLGSRALMPEASWAPQWADVAASESHRGRSRTVHPKTNPSGWTDERKALGLSAREHAKQLGLAWGTYCRLAKEALVATRQNTEEKGGPQMGTASFSGVSFVPHGEGVLSLNSHLWATKNPQKCAGSPSPRALAHGGKSETEAPPRTSPVAKAHPSPRWNPKEPEAPRAANSTRQARLVSRCLALPCEVVHDPKNSRVRPRRLVVRLVGGLHAPYEEGAPARMFLGDLGWLQ